MEAREAGSSGCLGVYCQCEVSGIVRDFGGMSRRSSNDECMIMKTLRVVEYYLGLKPSNASCR